MSPNKLQNISPPPTKTIPEMQIFTWQISPQWVPVFLRFAHRLKWIISNLAFSMLGWINSKVTFSRWMLLKEARWTLASLAIAVFSYVTLPCVSSCNTPSVSSLAYLYLGRIQDSKSKPTYRCKWSTLYLFWKHLPVLVSSEALAVGSCQFKDHFQIFSRSSTSVTQDHSYSTNATHNH